MESNMSRGKNKKTAQAEKILLVLLDGHEAPIGEIETLLSTHIVFNRFSAYLWDLKQIGAEIKRNRVGRKIVSYQLINTEVMQAYAQERGLIPPPAVTLTASDLMVAAG
jgi:hypothetical protein